MQKALESVTKYSNKIRELPVVRRVTVKYPLLCRDDVAKKLASVGEMLPEGLYLQVDSAYRTRKTQEILWKIRNKIMGDLVHNPINGIPPHCTGGAVDISLVDQYGKEINLSKPFKKFYMEPQLISNKITAESQGLRLELNKLMLENGFAPYPTEYWHFSYGDSVWAEYYHAKEIYGEISLPKDQYYPFIIRLYYKILKRIWRLVIKYLKIDTNY